MISLPLHYMRAHKTALGGESWDSWCDRHNIQRRPTARRRDTASAASRMIASPGGRFHCDQCDAVFTRTKQLTAHKTAKHMVRQAHEIIHCSICNHPCKGPGGLSKHVELVHPGGTFRDKRWKCQWPQCSELSWKIQAHLTRHINDEHDCFKNPEEAGDAAVVMLQPKAKAKAKADAKAKAHAKALPKAMPMPKAAVLRRPAAAGPRPAAAVLRRPAAAEAASVRRRPAGANT